MKYHFYSFLTVLLLLEMTSQCRSESVISDRELPEPNCGVRSLLGLARYLGHPADDAQTLAMRQAYPQDQVSLWDVQQAARSLGLDTEGVKATLTELQQRQQPFIAALPDHFVFVERVEADWVRYSEGQGLLLRPRSGFEQEYQGKALVLAATVKTNTLQITPAMLSWGKVPVGTLEKQAQILLTNTGTQLIYIQNIETSCSCTVTSHWPKQIWPGQQVPLQITMRLPSGGDFYQTVTITSNAAFPRQTVSVFGSLDSDVRLDPIQLSFGEIVVGSTVSRALTLYDADHKLSRPLQVSTASQFLQAHLVQKREDVFEITVTLAAPERPIDVDAALVITGQGVNGQTSPPARIVQVPVQAHIAPMTKVEPQRLVFGSVSLEGTTKTLQVSRQDNQPFEITKITAPDILACEIVPSNQRHTGWLVKVRLRPSHAPGQIFEHLTIATRKLEDAGGEDKSDNIDVPVSALVEPLSQSNVPLAR